MSRKYWLDLFTGKTWEEFLKQGNKGNRVRLVYMHKRDAQRKRGNEGRDGWADIAWWRAFRAGDDDGI